MERRALLAVSLQVWGLFTLLAGLVALSMWFTNRPGALDAHVWDRALRGQMLVGALTSIVLAGFVLVGSHRLACVLRALPDDPETGSQARPYLVAGLACAGFVSVFLAARTAIPTLVSPLPHDGFSEHQHVSTLRGAAASAVLGLGAILLPRFLARAREAKVPAAPPRAVAAAAVHTLGLGFFVFAGGSLATLVVALFQEEQAWGLASVREMSGSMLYATLGMPLVLAVAGLLLVRQRAWVAGLLNRQGADGPEPTIHLGMLRWVGLGLVGGLALLRGLSLLYYELLEPEFSGWRESEPTYVWSIVGYGALALAVFVGPQRVVRVLRGYTAAPRTFDSRPLLESEIARLLRITLGTWLLTSGVVLELVSRVTDDPTGSLPAALSVRDGAIVVAALAGTLLLVTGLPKGTLRSRLARPAFEVAAFVLLLEIVTQAAAVWVELEESKGAEFSSTAIWHGLTSPWVVLAGIVMVVGLLWLAHRRRREPAAQAR